MEKGRIKVMWYNILRGFHKKELNGFTFEPERLKAVKKVVANVNPDILFIGEGDFNPKCKIKGERIKTIDYQKEFNYPYLLLGDFNALSPEDKYKEEELFKLFYLFSKDKEAALNNVKGSIQTLMIKEIIKHGLIDTFKEKNKCQVITLQTKKYSPFNDKSIGIRLDYIFCSKDFNILESGIIQNKLTDIASDHYPIYAVLELG